MTTSSKNSNSNGIGLIRLNRELKITEKNLYCKKHLSLPRVGARIALVLDSKSEFLSISSLPERRASHVFVKFKYSIGIKFGLAVRLRCGDIALITHNSFDMVYSLNGVYGSDSLAVISGFVANLYENRIYDLASISGREIFPIDKKYISDGHLHIKAASISEATDILRDAIHMLKTKPEIRLTFGSGTDSHRHFTDIALLSYALSELIASSVIFSQNSRVSVNINVWGSTVLASTEGEYKLPIKKDAPISKADESKLRLTLISASLAALGIRTSFEFDGKRYRLGIILPLLNTPTAFHSPQKRIQVREAICIITHTLRGYDLLNYDEGTEHIVV